MDCERKRGSLSPQAPRAVLVGLLTITLAAFAGVDRAQAAASGVITAAQASAHIGETTTVEGHVDAVVCSELACLLSFEQGFSGFIASIPGKSRSRFPDPRKTYLDQNVRIRGKIEDRQGRPRVELSDPKKIEVVKQSVGVRSAKLVEGGAGARVSQGAAPGAAEAAAAAPEPIVAKGLDGRAKVVTVTQAEPQREEGGGLAGIRAALEQEALATGSPVEAPPPVGRDPGLGRAVADPGLLGPDSEDPAMGYAGGGGSLPLVDDPAISPGSEWGGAVEDEITALRDQVALLEQSVMELNQRLAAMESTGAATSGRLPTMPSYIVSETTSSTLRRVKRGWSSRQVLKVLGQPAEVVATVQGIETWNYGVGRSVTLDQRGRVMSSVGF